MTLDHFEEDGVTYFQLYSSCPVCWSHGVTTPWSNWFHYDNNCYGDIYVGENAYYKCKKCGQLAHIQNWKVSCPTHSNSHAFYLGESCSSAANIVGIVRTLSLTEIAGIPWVQRFCANLAKHGGYYGAK